MTGTVYILKSIKNGRYYVGSTLDLGRRLQEHNRGQVLSTKNLLPVQLVFKQEFASIVEARQVEHSIKKKKSRVIIEKIISEGKIGFIE